MAIESEEQLTDFASNGRASAEHLDAIEEHFQCKLPTDYRAFMNGRNGGEGFVGEQYLILWKAEEVVQFNNEYEANKYAPGLMLIGSTGGGEALAYDLQSGKMSIVMVPFVGMDVSHAIQIAPTFSAFLDRLRHAPL